MMRNRVDMEDVYKRQGCYWASIVLLVLVLIIGAAKKGAVRWISIAGFQFQPSEVSKILVVIYLANRLSAKDVYKRQVFYQASMEENINI